MNRKLKGLGLALVAMLALGGVVAVSAQAETGIVSEVKAVNGTNIDIANDINEHGKLVRVTVGSGARFIECTKIDFLKTTGFNASGTATTIKGTPEFTECFSNNLTSAPVSVTHEGCELELTVLKNSTAQVKGAAGCTKILVHVFENVKAQEEKKSLCTYNIPMPQTVTTAKTVVTGGKEGPTHDLTVDLTGSSQLNIKNEGPGGLAVCGIASGGEGKLAFSGALTISGTNAAGAAVGITLE